MRPEQIPDQLSGSPSIPSLPGPPRNRHTDAVMQEDGLHIPLRIHTAQVTAGLPAGICPPSADHEAVGMRPITPHPDELDKVYLCRLSRTGCRPLQALLLQAESRAKNDTSTVAGQR